MSAQARLIFQKSQKGIPQMIPAQNAYKPTVICFTAWLLREITVSPPLPQLMTYNSGLILQCTPVDTTGICNVALFAFRIQLDMQKHFNLYNENGETSE
jgi:hypothetical protein